MSTKNKVLSLLEQHRDTYISGQSIAQDLGVSRASVWKGIESLKAEGYDIYSSTKKGYMLQSGNDLLSEVGIRASLDDQWRQNQIYIFDRVNSTNTEAKKIGIDGGCHGTIVVANEQISGRGRFGRNFYSPHGKGIYLSVVLRPQIEIQDAAFSTILTVVAVMRALKKFTTDIAKIKWVNDIYVEDKKVCGILTELSHDIQSGGVDYLVAGIGININSKKEDFPEELQEIAGSITVREANRNELIGEIVNQLLPIFEDIDKGKIIAEYKRFQLVLGKEIDCIDNGEMVTAKAVDIGEDGSLIIEYQGQEKRLNSGEISVRIKK